MQSDGGHQQERNSRMRKTNICQCSLYLLRGEVFTNWRSKHFSGDNPHTTLRSHFSFDRAQSVLYAWIDWFHE